MGWDAQHIRERKAPRQANIQDTNDNDKEGQLKPGRGITQARKHTKTSETAKDTFIYMYFLLFLFVH